MPVRFTVGGVKCVIHLDWLGINVYGIEQIPQETYKYLPSLKHVGQCGTHEKFYKGHGIKIKAEPRTKVNNAPFEIELRGEYFSSDWSLDSMLRSLYEAGAYVTIHRIDYAFDFYGAVDRFEPKYLPQYEGNLKHYETCGKWSGFRFGKNLRAWRFYDKRIEQIYEHGAKPSDMPEEWWRAEVALRGDYAKQLTDNINPFELDLEEIAPNVLKGTRVFSIPWLTSIMEDLKEGRISFYVVRRTTYEASYKALYNECMRKIRRFWDKHHRPHAEDVKEFAVFAGAFATDIFEGTNREANYLHEVQVRSRRKTPPPTS